MATVALEKPPAESRAVNVVAVAVLLGIMLSACALAGLAPIGFSIVTVFLFAGPHNWLEARYMLSRMPARWGPLRLYFLLGIGGAVTLTALFALMPSLPWSENGWMTSIAVWNSLLIGWIVALSLLRSRQNPRRDWRWLVPLGFVLLAANWLWPLAWSLALVYVHPLLALWFLDRELARQRASWQWTYRACLTTLPLFVLVLWWQLGSRPDLQGEGLVEQITDHAGAGVFRGVSTHFLVATHTFLEMLHYGVWIVAIPLVSVKALPWQVDGMPLARRSFAWRQFVLGTLAVGAAVMLVLWTGFLADYPLTRSIYFTVAMLHVLAEVPFLLRLL